MRKIIHITVLYLGVLRSDKSAFFWLLAMPIVFTFVTGFVYPSGGGRSGPVRYALTVVNLDEGGRGAELLAAVEEADEIDLLLLEEPGADSTAIALVDDGDRSAALIIPADYSAKIGGGAQATIKFHRNPERMNPLVTREAVERVLSRLNAEAMVVAGAREAYAELWGEPTEEKAAELTGRARSFVADAWERPPVTVSAETVGRTLEERLPPGGYSHSSPAMALMWVLLNGLMASSFLVSERREKTLMRLFTAPVRRSEIIVGNLAWRFVVGLVQMWFLIGFGALVFGVDWGDSPTALLLVTVTYIAAVAGLSVLIGSTTRTSRQAESLSLILSLSMCALGGLWWPLEITPKAYQTVGHLIPTGWAMDAMHNLVGRGYTLAEVAPQAAALAGFAVIFTVAATLTFRHE
jgi:ABC-2 type transport system permease protein